MVMPMKIDYLEELVMTHSKVVLDLTECLVIEVMTIWKVGSAATFSQVMEGTIT